MDRRTALLLVVPFVLAGCSSGPPKPWLRFVAEDPKGWQTAADGRLTTQVLGASLQVDLHTRDPQIELQVDNRSGGDVSIRVGPEATQTPTASIGDLRRRPLDQSRGEDVTKDFVPYVSMQSIELRNGWRAEFYIMSPLGRDPSIGQFLQLVIEVHDAKGTVDRRSLPLVATNVAPNEQRH
jgi:hypothetical protein